MKWSNEPHVVSSWIISGLMHNALEIKVYDDWPFIELEWWLCAGEDDSGFFWDRVKSAWQILRYGKTRASHSINLSTDTANEISFALQDAVEQWNKLDEKKQDKIKTKMLENEEIVNKIKDTLNYRMYATEKDVTRTLVEMSEDAETLRFIRDKL